jgi:hypothetical protein
MMRRDGFTVRTGDVVRIYGYPGTFTAYGDTTPRTAAVPTIRVYRNDPQRDAVTMSLSSVVEINGTPVPLLSCPIAAPAADYPHEPLFDYDDGPEGNAVAAARAWRNRRAAWEAAKEQQRADEANARDAADEVVRDRDAEAERRERLEAAKRQQRADDAAETWRYGVPCDI